MDSECPSEHHYTRLHGEAVRRPGQHVLPPLLPSIGCSTGSGSRCRPTLHSAREEGDAPVLPPGGRTTVRKHWLKKRSPNERSVGDWALLIEAQGRANRRPR